MASVVASPSISGVWIVEPQVPGLAPLAVALPVKRDPVVDVAWLAEKVFSRSVELVFTATV